MKKIKKWFHIDKNGATEFEKSIIKGFGFVLGATAGITILVLLFSVLTIILG